MAACATNPVSQILCSSKTVLESKPTGTNGASRACLCTNSCSSSRNLGTCTLDCSGGIRRKEHLGRKISLVDDVWVVRERGERSSGLNVEAAKRIVSGRSYVLSSTLIVQEGNEEQVENLCKGVLQWAQEKKKEKGSGIQLFECNVDPFEKGVYHFWERYESFIIMNDIRASPEHTKFMTDVRQYLTGPVGLAAYEYKDGKIGHMMNPIGPKGEGGLDDATGQSGSKQQSSAINQGIGDTHEERQSWGLDKLLAKVRGEEDNSGAWNLNSVFGEAKK